MTTFREITGKGTPPLARLRNGHTRLPGLDAAPARFEEPYHLTGHSTEKRILVADHYEIARIGLNSILKSHSGWQVVAEADNGKHAIAQAQKVRPDIFITDAALPLIDGIEAARQIRASLPETEVLIFVAYESEALVNDALAAGARAILDRSDAKADLIAAVKALAIHRPFFAGRLSEMIVRASLSGKSARTEAALSPRERSVVRLICDGHGNKQIGDILSLSVKTIETHRATAKRKLGVNSTAELVRYAVRRGLIEP